MWVKDGCAEEERERKAEGEDGNEVRDRVAWM